MKDAVLRARISARLLERLDRVLARKGLSRSEWLVTQVSKYVDEEENAMAMINEYWVIKCVDADRSEYRVGCTPDGRYYWFAWACDRSASDAEIEGLLREASKTPGRVFGTDSLGAIVGLGPEVRSEIQARAILVDETVAAQVRALADDIPAGSRQLRAYPHIDGSSDWHISRQDALLLAAALQLKIRELEQRIAAIRNPEPNPETDWLTPLLDPDGSNAQLQIELLERELQRARELHGALR